MTLEQETTAHEQGNDLPASRKVEFGYDDAGRRIWKTSYVYSSAAGAWLAKETRKFVYDRNNLVADFVVDPNGMDRLSRAYAWGKGIAGSVGGLLSITTFGDDGSTPTATYIPLYDDRGNVVGLANASDGKLVAVYQYDPFGKLIGEAGDKAVLDANPFGFNTMYTDRETGLVWFQPGGYYSPALQRRLSREPLGEGESAPLYVMFHNDPINRVDPDGFEDVPTQAKVEPALDLAMLKLQRLAYEYDREQLARVLDNARQSPTEYNGPTISADNRSAFKRWRDRMMSKDYWTYHPQDHSAAENFLNGQEDSFGRRALQNFAAPPALAIRDLKDFCFNLAVHPVDTAVATKRTVDQGLHYLVDWDDAKADYRQYIASTTETQRRVTGFRFLYGAAIAAELGSGGRTSGVRSANRVAPDFKGAEFRPIVSAPRTPLYGGFTGPAMDEAWFQRIKAGFERTGGAIDQGVDAQAYLKMRDVGGVTWDAKTVFLHEKPTASSGFEELIHTAQHRTGEFSRAIDALGNARATDLMEIRAAEKLIRNRHAYQISNEETRQIIERLRGLRKGFNE